MKAVSPELLKEFLQSVEEAVKTLRVRYPQVSQLTMVENLFEEEMGIYFLSLPSAMEIEVMLRSIVWDLLPDDREQVRVVVKKFDTLLQFPKGEECER